MASSIENFIWHDGNITELNYSIVAPIASVLITGYFYSNSESSGRDKFTIRCEGVTEITNKIDVNEMVDNSGAGSVSNGYLKQGTLWIYLLDGIIEVRAKEFNVVKH